MQTAGQPGISARWPAHLWAGLAVFAVTAVCVLLVRFPPGTSALSPRCAFRVVTGLLCPGCGATHAIAALARLDLSGAWHANPLATAAAPLALGYGSVAYARAIRGCSPIAPRFPRAAVVLLWIVTLGFGVARNL